MAKRCPACNANRTTLESVNHPRQEIILYYTKCTVCQAQWTGELIPLKDMSSNEQEA